MMRRVELVIGIPDPAGEVWKVWTTTDGVKSFFAFDANINLTVGGKYELYFDRSALAGKLLLSK